MRALYTQIDPVLTVPDPQAEAEFYRRLGFLVKPEGSGRLLITCGEAFRLELCAGRDGPLPGLHLQTSDLPAVRDLCRRSGLEAIERGTTLELRSPGGSVVRIEAAGVPDRRGHAVLDRRAPEGPLAVQAFGELAGPYAERVDTKAHNADYERPATLSLLPEVNGLDVLDACCGPGAYADLLVQRGARVVAFDASPRMVALAKGRLGRRAKVLQYDLNEDLDFLSDSAFDLVLCALALDYVLDWEHAFSEFLRVLRPGGGLVFSIGHPLPDFDHPGAHNYFAVEQLVHTWRGFGKPVDVPFYRRPFGAVITPLLEAGFVLDRLLEPQPTEAFRAKEPEDYEKLTHRPGFLCVRAIKPALRSKETDHAD